MFLAACEKLCKEQGIILLAASEVHNREEENAFLTQSSFSDLQKFMSERKERGLTSSCLGNEDVPGMSET